MGEISTLRELFTALSEATENPKRLLDEAEMVLAHTGVPTLGIGGDVGVSVSTGQLLRTPGTSEAEAFASAFDAIMTSKQRQKATLAVRCGDEATGSLASESLGSTSSGWSSVGGSCAGTNGSKVSPNSSQVSIHSSNSSAFATQHQMAAILRESHSQVSQTLVRFASTLELLFLH